MRPGKTSLALAGALISASAHAEPPADPTVQQLFEEGRALAEAGRFAEACPKFEETLRLDGGIGARFNLADCYEHLGRTATAWALFRDTAAAAAIARQPERERAAIARADALETRLCRLWIEVDAVRPPAAAPRVTRDGVPVGEAQWGVPIAVDPGTHRVAVDGVALVPWAADVRVVGCPATIVARVPLVSARALEEPAPVPSREAAATSSEVRSLPVPHERAPRQARPDERASSWRTTAGIGMAAGGAALLVAGGATLAYALQRKSDSGGSCAGDQCTPDGLAARSDAVHAGNVATALIVGGAVVGGIGIVLWAWPAGRGAAQAVSIGPSGVVARAEF